MYSNKSYDFYEVIGEQKQDDKQSSINLLHLNPPERYFIDTKEYDAWVRIRNDHL